MGDVSGRKSEPLFDGGVDQWHDAVDYAPTLTCKVLMLDGSICEAAFIHGSGWERVDDQEIIYPTHFWPFAVRVIVPLYEPPFEVEE